MTFATLPDLSTIVPGAQVMTGIASVQTATKVDPTPRRTWTTGAVVVAMLRTRGARSIAMNDTQSPPKSGVQDRYFGLLRCVGCFPGVCSEDAPKGIFDDHRTARRALKSADIAENSIERSWSQHHVRFTLRAVWHTRFHPLSPSNGNVDFATQEPLVGFRVQSALARRWGRVFRDRQNLCRFQ